MSNIGNGEAPCGGCGKTIRNIPVNMSSKEPDGNGGHWYEVSSSGANCLQCGEPMKWLHTPAPPDLGKELFASVMSVIKRGQDV